MDEVEAFVEVNLVEKRQRRAFSSAEKTNIWNIYQTVRNSAQTLSNNDVYKSVALSMGVHWLSIYRIVKEKEKTKKLKPPKMHKKREMIVDRFDDFTKCAIRQIIHDFFGRNEIPTLDKIMAAIDNDGTLETIKRTTLNQILKKIGFKYSKKSKNRLLIDRDEIFFWRRNYLREIKKAREENKKIYYLGETWVDTNGLPTGSNNSTGKGKRLVITHIGSVDGFVQGGLHVFDQDMNAEVFEYWFEGILEKLDDNCVIVMDNASHHTRRIENVPNEKTKKQDIIYWLNSKGIPFPEDCLKRELLNIVKTHKERYGSRVVDEMAKAENITVFRLPPYHSELNPMELIWPQVKERISTENKTFQMDQQKHLLINAIENIHAGIWEECIQHVIDNVEPKMNQMDINVEGMTETFLRNVGSDESSSESSSSDGYVLGL